MLKSIKTILYFLVLLSVPAMSAESQSHRYFLGKNEFTLDSKTWSYYAPGVFTKSKLIPIKKEGGLLIKYAEDQKRRLTYLIHEATLNTSAAGECRKMQVAWAGSKVEPNRHGCTFLSEKADGSGTAAWVFEDFRSLRLFTITVVYEKGKKNEVVKDLQYLRGAISRS